MADIPKITVHDFLGIAYVDLSQLSRWDRWIFYYVCRDADFPSVEGISETAYAHDVKFYFQQKSRRIGGRIIPATPLFVAAESAYLRSLVEDLPDGDDDADLSL